MDVLLGSIDVCELLSTEDLDGSSPLSAPDLRLLVDRLQTRSLHIKSKVRDYVLSHHRDFADIFCRCAASAAGVDEAAKALANVLGLLSERPLDRDICDIVKGIGRKRRELEEQKEALAVVRTVSTLLDRLKAVSDDIRAGRLVKAAVDVRDLKIGLRFSEVEDNKRVEEEPAFYGFLRKEWSDCFDELQSILSKCVESSIKFDPENNSVTVRSTFKSGGGCEFELYSTLEAMEIVGFLDYGLAKVADLMIKFAISPALTNNSTFVWEESDEDCMAVIRIDSSSRFQGDTEVFGTFSSLSLIIKFIYKYICFENGTWMQCFGKLTWPRMSNLIISHCLSKAVPEDAAKMAEFEDIIRLTMEFENSLKEMMFISYDNNNEQRLSHFAHNVEVHFACRKKCEILAKARGILLQLNSLDTTWNISMHSYDACEAVDLLFQPEKCCVSRALSQILQLVHETLTDACKSSARVAKEFYHAARDVMLLYKAIVPAKMSKHLNDVSQEAIVVHNDCYYLSQEILGLAFQYRADFPSSLKKFVVFVDIAPSFYQMAENVLQTQIELVINRLKEAIDGADGFQNTHQPQQFELAKFSIDQVVFILEKVRVIWEPLMATSTYKRTMCILLETTFSRITKDLLLLDDIAAEETLQLQRLVHMALENLLPLLHSVTGEADEKLKLIEGALFDELIPSLRKLRRLADLFDMPLKSITSLWESGELVNDGFTSSEIENFIRGVFTDSPLRKECLRRIETTQK